MEQNHIPYVYQFSERCHLIVSPHHFIQKKGYNALSLVKRNPAPVFQLIIHTISKKSINTFSVSPTISTDLQKILTISYPFIPCR